MKELLFGVALGVVIGWLVAKSFYLDGWIKESEEHLKCQKEFSDYVVKNNRWLEEHTLKTNEVIEDWARRARNAEGRLAAPRPERN